MRPLEESEIQQVFEKLFKFVGKNLKNIVDRADQPHCFRLHKKVRPSATVVPASPRVPRLPPSPRSRKPPDAFSTPSRPRSRPAPRLATTVMRKYPRFRTASVDEAQTIYMVEFLRLSRRDRGRGFARLPPRRRLVLPSLRALTSVPSTSSLAPAQRVYYVREDIMKRATSIARDQLVSLGVCIGKFTHSDKFRLTIGALELLAAHAKHKVRRGIRRTRRAEPQSLSSPWIARAR